MRVRVIPDLIDVLVTSIICIYCIIGGRTYAVLPTNFLKFVYVHRPDRLNNFAVWADLDNLNTTNWQNTGDGRDRLISIENVRAGSGNDIVIGNGAANTLNGQAGSDRLYGAGGNDLLIGGGGKDRVWGQAGRDTFLIQSGSGHTIIKDFSDGADRIQLGSGSSGLKLKTRGDDVLIYQRRDLMAIVEDAAGDLQRRGRHLG